MGGMSWPDWMAKDVMKIRGTAHKRLFCMQSVVARSGPRKATGQFFGTRVHLLKDPRNIGPSEGLHGALWGLFNGYVRLHGALRTQGGPKKGC